MIDQCIKNFLNKIFVLKRTLTTVPKNVYFIVLPSLSQFYINLRSRLYKCFNKTLPWCNIKVIFQSKNHLSNPFRFKDSIPKGLGSHLVYKFLCNNCNITYYGETEHHLSVRSQEHLSLTALIRKCVNSSKKLAVKDNSLSFKHMGSFEDLSILTYASNPFKL